MSLISYRQDIQWSTPSFLPSHTVLFSSSLLPLPPTSFLPPSPSPSSHSSHLSASFAATSLFLKPSSMNSFLAIMTALAYSSSFLLELLRFFICSQAPLPLCGDNYTHTYIQRNLRTRRLQKAARLSIYRQQPNCLSYTIRLTSPYNSLALAQP